MAHAMGSSNVVAWWPEEVTTDGGSHTSDAETTCSSVCTPDATEQKPKRLLPSEAAPTLLNAARRSANQNRIFLPRSCALLKRGPFFSGTPLSPIPGTPSSKTIVNTEKAHFFLPEGITESPSEDHAANGPKGRTMSGPMLPTAAPPRALARVPEPAVPLMVLPVASAPPRGTAPPQMLQQRVPRPALRRTSPAAAPAVFTRDHHGNPLAPVPSPRHCARATTPRDGQQEAVPMKIWLPAHLAKPRKACDPTLPVKKLPVYPDFAADALDALRKLDRDLPVKVRVPGFLLHDAPCVQPCALAR